MLRTLRDRAILECVSFKVRMLSLEQVARTWWGETSEPRRFAGRRMGELVAAGLLVRQQVLARPILPLLEPVVTWRPDTAGPDVGAAAYRLQSRWTKAPETTAVYLASPKTLGQLGGAGGKLPVLGQETHDLHVAEIYVKRLGDCPEDAAAWAGEEIFKTTRRGEKLPDAVLQDAAGRPRRVIEFGGDYDAERVRRFHDDCAQRGLAYELW